MHYQTLDRRKLYNYTRRVIHKKYRCRYRTLYLFNSKYSTVRIRCCRFNFGTEISRKKTIVSHINLTNVNTKYRLGSCHDLRESSTIPNDNVHLHGGLRRLLHFANLVLPFLDNPSQPIAAAEHHALAGPGNIHPDPPGHHRNNAKRQSLPSLHLLRNLRIHLNATCV